MKLIFLDIDGTLTNGEKVITQKTRDALLLAEKKGIILALASARPTHGLYKCAAELEMKNYNGLLMAYNGGRCDDSLSVVRTAAFYLEIIPRSINKGTGLFKICTALGIDPKDALAFGDSENDIPMLETAGCGVAMENAEDALKKHADFVTFSNNEDGIAAFLESQHIISY